MVKSYASGPTAEEAEEKAVGIEIGFGGRECDDACEDEEARGAPSVTCNGGGGRRGDDPACC